MRTASSWLVLVCASLLACAGTGSSASEAGSVPDTSATSDKSREPGEPRSCAGVGSSTLDGACIWFPEPAGSFTLAEAGAGIEIPYVVFVDAELPDVVPRSQDAGDCFNPGESGLTLFEDLGGGEQRYCLCDEGLCAPQTTEPRTIPAGRTAQSFVWTGVNWWGASDTDNPYGPPFPAGTYTLEVSAVGTVGGREFRVSNRYELTLTE